MSSIGVKPKTLKRFNRMKYSFEEDLIQDDLINKALDALDALERELQRKTESL